MQFIEDHEDRAAALVRRRGRHDRLRRRHEHRSHAAHRPHPRRRGGGPGRGDAAVRLRPGGRGARDQAQGARPAGDAGPGHADDGRAEPDDGRPPAGPDSRGHAGQAPGSGCCSSTTRTRSCTRWPATSASWAAEVTTLRAGLRPGAARPSYAPDLVVLSPGPGRPSDFGCDKLLAALDERRAAGRSASAWGCRRWSSTRAARWRLLGDAGARQAGAGAGAGRRAAGRPAARVHRGPVPLAARPAEQVTGGFDGHRGDHRTGW